MPGKLGAALKLEAGCGPSTSSNLQESKRNVGRKKPGTSVGGGVFIGC